MLNYATAAENGSMYNTPPCWPIYICGLVFKHLLKLGGLAGTFGGGSRGDRGGHRRTEKRVWNAEEAVHIWSS
jgi:hypothetical protein